MKHKSYIAVMSVSVLLTACQHTQTSKPEAATMTAPAAVAAPLLLPPRLPLQLLPTKIIIDNGDPSFKSEGNGQRPPAS